MVDPINNPVVVIPYNQIKKHQNRSVTEQLWRKLSFSSGTFRSKWFTYRATASNRLQTESRKRIGNRVYLTVISLSGKRSRQAAVYTFFIVDQKLLPAFQSVYHLINTLAGRTVTGSFTVVRRCRRRRPLNGTCIRSRLLCRSRSCQLGNDLKMGLGRRHFSFFPTGYRTRRNVPHSLSKLSLGYA